MMASPAPAITSRGMEDNMTRVSSHPLTNAMMKPPMNVDTSCINFPTCTNITGYLARKKYWQYG
jgi:hypothetical protein